MKLIKYAIYTVLVLLALAIAGAAIFAMTFDPNRYKGELERLVQERTGRTLKLSGDLELALWPSLGARVNGVTLSERDGQGQFVALDSAHASVAVMPLLSGEVVVDGVTISGLKAQVVKDKQGRFNFQDLLGEDKAKPAAKPAPEKGAGGPVKLDIAGVTIENSAVSYRDLATGQELALSGLEVSVGRISDRAEGKLKLSVHAKGNDPALDARVEFASGYRFDLPANAYTLSNVDARASGAAAGLTGIELGARGDIAVSLATNDYRLSDLAIDFQAMQGKDALSAKLAAPSVVVAADAAKGQAVKAEFRLKGPDRSVEALLKLAGVQGSAKALVVPQFSADLAVTDPALPMKSLKVPVSGTLRADLEKQTAQADIKAKIDDTALEGRLGLAKFTPPAYRFDVNIDRLNLDRYFPPEKKAVAGAPEKKAEKGDAGNTDTPVDLSGLKGLDASGRLQVGALQARGLKLANVKAEMRAANGRVEVAPHSADLYGGSVSGALSAQADGNRIAVKEKLTKVSIGPLLRDFADLDRLEGTGSLSLDLSAAGASVEAMKRALDGTAQLALRDGAIKGINIAQVLRKAKASLGRGDAQAAAETEKTDFSEMSASFRVSKGVARNDDLDVKAPLFRITGSGEVDVGRSRIDYKTKVAVVGTAKGQGGADLAELAGISVPVHLTGPLDNMKYDVDYGAVAADLAKTKAGDSLKSQIEKQRGRLEDRLKGLLNR